MTNVSVIVPIYNVERYLEECLDSITGQSLQDIEIICVNDGSTDASPAILEEYAKKDSRIRIFNQENQGAGAARNFAISKAEGKYVYFMDADDYLELDCLETAYDICEEKSLDFVMFKVSNFHEDTGEVIDDDYYTMPYLKRRVGENAFNYDDVSDIALDLCVCPPGNLFNRRFIEDIRFPEGLLFEDNVFFAHALFKADSIYFLDEFLYNRRKRPDSTTTPITVRSIDTIDITDMLLDLCDEFGHDHRRELYYRIFHNIYDLFKREEIAQKEELFNKIKADYLKYRDKWERDDYFANDLNPRYKHIFNCAIASGDWKAFESCVDSHNTKKDSAERKSRFKRLRERLS